MVTERISSRQNPLIVNAVKLLSDTKHRKAQNVIAAEGSKLLADAAESGAKITAVIASENLEGLLPPFYAERLVYVPERLFSTISTQKSPQGVLFFCARPEARESLEQGRYLILDGLQDPGNVGTVIRTAAALGIHGVVLCGASADPFAPKAVRASMGGIFRIPVHQMQPAQLKLECEKNGIPLYAAMPAGNAADLRDIKSGPLAVVVGSEGTGVSQEVLALCSGRVTIPMVKGAESLNAAVAAAIILWEMARSSL